MRSIAPLTFFLGYSAFVLVRHPFVIAGCFEISITLLFA